MNEQETYSQSLEARINRLKTTWTEFASVAGDTIIYDGIVVLTQFLKGATEGGKGFVGFIGALGPILGVAGFALIALNTNLRNSVIEMGRVAVATYQASGAVGIFGKVSAGAVAGVTALRGAITGLLASTGVGLILLGVGIAIEKLTSVISKNIQEQEKFDAYMKKNSEALTTNKDAVNRLLTEYNALSKAKAEGTLSTEEEEKYLDVQTRLGDMFPALIDYVDSSGQSHLKSSEAIKEEIAQLEKLETARKKALVAGAKEEFAELTKDVTGGAFASLNNFIYGSLQAQIKQTKQILDSLRENNPTSDQIAILEYELLQLETQYAQSTEEIISKINEVADATHNLQIDPVVKQSLDEFLNSLDVSKLDPAQLKTFSVAYGELQKDIQNAIKNQDKEAYKQAVKDLNELAKAMGLIDPKAKGFKQSYNELIEAIKKGNGVISVEGDNMGDLASGIDGVAGAIEDYKSAVERLAGVSEQQITDAEELLYEYDQLSNIIGLYTEQQIKDATTKKELNAEEQVLKGFIDDRTKAMNALASIYPDLLQKDGKAISLSKDKKKAIEEELRVQKILTEAYKLGKEGKLNAEQEATVATARATIARIAEIRKEIQALILLQEQIYNTSRTTEEFLKSIEAGTEKSVSPALAGLPQPVFQAVAIDKKNVQLEQLDKLLNSSVSKVESFTASIKENDKANKGSTKSQKDKNAETQKSIYITDKYKKQLDELNLAIQKQQAIQEDQPESAEKYRKALEAQIKLEQQKLTLIQNQAKSLDNQIKSGKIQQTGSVSVKNDTKSTAVSYSKEKGAFGGRVSSGYGYRTLGGVREFHRGIDIASSRGTPVYSNVTGKVIKAGNASSSNNGKAMSGTYGNIVVVQDDKGLKHIFAHLDKTIAKFGDTITAGTQLGTVGSTGNSTGNHLHYEQNTASGKLVDPTSTVNSIRKNGLPTGGAVVSGGGVVDNSQQAVDQAIADLNSLYGNIIEQEDRLNELQEKLVNSYLAGYEYRKNNYDQFLENSDNRLKKLNDTSAEYRKELDGQIKALRAKKTENQSEIKYLQNTIKNGGLTDKVLEGLNKRLHDLGKVNSEIDFAISDREVEKAESLVRTVDTLIEKYGDRRDLIENSLELERLALQDIDIASARYTKTLADINTALKNKQNINREELSNLEKLIYNGSLYGDGLKNAQARVQELNKEIKELQIEIQQGNYEIFVKVGVVYEDAIQNINNEISRFEAIRKMYEQGSSAYSDYTRKLIAEQEKLAEQYKKLRDAQIAELKVQDLNAEDRRKAIQSIKDQNLAYINATNAIKDYQKQLEEAGKSQKEDIANKFISALKEYYQELRDEQIKAIDELAKKEQEAHEKRVKNLNDELNLFRKNVEERLRLIDRQEAERDYNLEIEDLQKERNSLQEEYNSLLLDPTTKAQRKKIQEQLDKIDKDIAEKRHKRDIELQKQGLSDQLELKEEEINGKIELENEEYKAIQERIDKEKRYWEQYYTDLLNDEREFARIREEILAGNFDKIVAEFENHIDRMKATFPDLANTLDGTMKAVGQVLRQNVIDHLEEAIRLAKEFQEVASNTGSFTDGFDSSIFDNPNGDYGQSKGSLTEGDLKVLLGKFLTDNVANQLTGSAKTQAHLAGGQLGSSGRAQGSTISKDADFSSAIKGLTPAELETLKQYFQSNANVGGGSYAEFIKSFAGGGSGYNPPAGGGTNLGLGTPLKYGDLQVLMAKYINENLLKQTQNPDVRANLKTKADSLAQQGRASGSQVSASTTFFQLESLLNDTQRNQLKSFMGGQAGIISDMGLRNSFLNFVASLDTGGMLSTSGRGVDGKGGKFYIGHDGEVVNSPLQTDELLQTARENRAMANTLAQSTAGLNNAINPYATNSSSSNEGLTIQFYGNIGTIGKQNGEEWANQIFDKFKRTKG